MAEKKTEKNLFLVFGLIQAISLGFIIYFILNSLSTIGLDTQIVLSCIFPVFLLMTAAIITPYASIIYKTSGEFHLTSPEKKLYDLSEGVWITSGKKGAFLKFTYIYGDPGEYGYKKLKEVVGKSPGKIYV